MNPSVIHITPQVNGTLAVRIPYKPELLSRIRSIPGRRWDFDNKIWYIADLKQSLDVILQAAIDTGSPVFIGSSGNYCAPDETEDEHIAALRRELAVRKYSQNTIKSYVHYNSELISASGKNPGEITYDDITGYIYREISDKNISTSTVQIMISAIKFFYGEILGRDFTCDITVPRKDKKLPVVLSRNEVMAVLDSIANLKHRTIMMLIYSAGLRLNEAVTIRKADIDTERGMIIIRSAKGRKDRSTLLSEKFKLLLVNYIEIYKPQTWLFEGQEKGSHLSARTVQHVFQTALEKAGINKDATVHSLRHSFATHLLEQGVDIRYIQELLGHQNPNTTMIYTHVSTSKIKSIKSPMDI